MMEKLRIHATQAFTVLLFLILFFTSSAWEEKSPVVTIILFFLGAVFVGIASMGRLWCSIYIAGYKTDRLIKEGPYSICRNPLYFFSFIGASGVGMATESLLIPFLIILTFTIYYPMVIKSEEAEMLKKHGKEYEAYLSQVPSFFPDISKLKEPDSYITKPIIFRKHIFSALWFVWLLGILELIEGFHELHVLPVIFNIY